MTRKIAILSLMVAIALLASSTVGLISAFDPGGPPVAAPAPAPAPAPARPPPAPVGKSGPPDKNWEMINHNALGTSYNPQNQINKDNAALLELKWIFPYPSGPNIAGASKYEGSGAPAIVVDGLVYAATNQRSLIALDAGTGKMIWNKGVPYDNNKITQQYKHVRGVLPHTHGVNYYADKGWIIPSYQACQIDAHDALSGDVVFQLLEICGTFDEAQKWGNQGFYASIGTHPPQFYGDIMIVPTMGSSGNGGRSFIAGWDISSSKPQRIWQTFVMPPADGDPQWATRECDKGWFFSYPAWAKDGTKGIRCRDVPRDALMNDWLSPFTSKVHTASTIATVWGHYLVDQESGIVYLGLGESGPYPNAEGRPGPNLYGSSIVALDAKTGKFVWWYQAVPHDLIDADCAWNTVLGKIDNRKVIFKACKNGFLYALDAATGEPVWVFKPPGLWIPAASQGLDPTSKQQMSKKWPGHPETRVLVMNYAGGIEADIAFDGQKVYVSSYNMPAYLNIDDSLPPFGNTLRMVPAPHPINATIYGLDAKTGKIVWEYFIDGVGYRGGLTVSGGLLWVPSGDGNLHILDANTGKLVAKKNFGTGLWTQVTIGADPAGKIKVFVQTGGMTIASWGPTGIPGALMAYGLPDTLPAAKEVTKEVVKEVIKEVQKEVIKEVPKEVIKEVIKEVTKEVRIKEEVINPLSYVLAGVGLIFLVVTAVMFTRYRGSK